eukprot:tig00001094_g6975.t1
MAKVHVAFTPSVVDAAPPDLSRAVSRAQSRATSRQSSRAGTDTEGADAEDAARVSKRRLRSKTISVKGRDAVGKWGAIKDAVKFAKTLKALSSKEATSFNDRFKVAWRLQNPEAAAEELPLMWTLRKQLRYTNTLILILALLGLLLMVADVELSRYVDGNSDALASSQALKVGVSASTAAALALLVRSYLLELQIDKCRGRAIREDTLWSKKRLLARLALELALLGYHVPPFVALHFFERSAAEAVAAPGAARGGAAGAAFERGVDWLGALMFVRLYRVLPVVRDWTWRSAAAHLYSALNSVDLDVPFTIRTHLHYRPLRVIVPLLAVLETVGGYLLWVVERDDPSSEVATFHDALWLTFVSLTTVGFGDRVPATFEGRAVIVLVIFCGLTMTAIYTAVVFDSLTLSYVERLFVRKVVRDISRIDTQHAAARTIQRLWRVHAARRAQLARERTRRLFAPDPDEAAVAERPAERASAATRVVAAARTVAQQLTGAGHRCSRRPSRGAWSARAGSSASRPAPCSARLRHDEDATLTLYTMNEAMTQWTSEAPRVTPARRGPPDAPAAPRRPTRVGERAPAPAAVDFTRRDADALSFLEPPPSPARPPAATPLAPASRPSPPVSPMAGPLAGRLVAHLNPTVAYAADALAAGVGGAVSPSPRGPPRQRRRRRRGSRAPCGGPSEGPGGGGGRRGGARRSALAGGGGHLVAGAAAAAPPPAAARRAAPAPLPPVLPATAATAAPVELERGAAVASAPVGPLEGRHPPEPEPLFLPPVAPAGEGSGPGAAGLEKLLQEIRRAAEAAERAATEAAGARAALAGLEQRVGALEKALGSPRSGAGAYAPPLLSMTPLH